MSVPRVGGAGNLYLRTAPAATCRAFQTAVCERACGLFIIVGIVRSMPDQIIAMANAGCGQA